MRLSPDEAGSETSPYTVEIDHALLKEKFYFYANPSPAAAGAPSKRGEVVETEEVVCPEILFTENETNFERLYGGQNRSYAKDAFHDHIIPSHRPESDRPKVKMVKRPKHPDVDNTPTRPSNALQLEDPSLKAAQTSPEPVSDGSDPTTPTAQPSTPPNDDFEEVEVLEEPYVPRQYVNPDMTGTKAGAHYVFKDVPPKGGCAVVRFKLSNKTVAEDPSIADEESFDMKLEERRQDSDEFYARFNPGGSSSNGISDDLRNIMRQALAGMLWTKQFYYFVQKEWIEGDPGQPPPPPERKWIRNKDWKHMYIEDILSMPDKWEVNQFHNPFDILDYGALGSKIFTLF